MSDKVKFISTQLLKENTTIQDNVDDDILVPYIYMAQDINLQQVLGSSFYDRLKEGVVNNDLNADETKLIKDFIQPMIIQWSLYRILPHLMFKLTNKSVSKESSEWSQNSELNEMKYLRDDIRNDAEFLTKRLQEYLCDYYELFDKYKNPDDNENLRKSSTAYFNGVYIPKRSGYDRYHKKKI